MLTGGHLFLYFFLFGVALTTSASFSLSLSLSLSALINVLLRYVRRTLSRNMILHLELSLTALRLTTNKIVDRPLSSAIDSEIILSLPGRTFLPLPTWLDLPSYSFTRCFFLFIYLFFVCLFVHLLQMDSSTHRGTIRQSFGGVGRNIADGLSHLTIRPLFISTMGNDSHADDLIAHNPLMVNHSDFK